MDFRFSQKHTDKMNGYLYKEYKPVSIPQFSQPTPEEPTPKLIGFIKAQKIVASHPIDKVLFDSTGHVVVLTFKDDYTNQVLSAIDYNKLWKKKNTEINKEYDKKYSRGHRIMNIVSDKLDIKSQKEDGLL